MSLDNYPQLSIGSMVVWRHYLPSRVRVSQHYKCHQHNGQFNNDIAQLHTAQYHSVIIPKGIAYAADISNKLACMLNGIVQANWELAVRWNPLTLTWRHATSLLSGEDCYVSTKIYLHALCTYFISCYFASTIFCSFWCNRLGKEFVSPHISA